MRIISWVDVVQDIHDARQSSAQGINCACKLGRILAATSSSLRCPARLLSAGSHQRRMCMCSNTCAQSAQGTRSQHAPACTGLAKSGQCLRMHAHLSFPSRPGHGSSASVRTVLRPCNTTKPATRHSRRDHGQLRRLQFGWRIQPDMPADKSDNLHKIAEPVSSSRAWHALQMTPYI